MGRFYGIMAQVLSSLALALLVIGTLLVPELEAFAQLQVCAQTFPQTACNLDCVLTVLPSGGYTCTNGRLPIVPFSGTCQQVPGCLGCTCNLFTVTSTNPQGIQTINFYCTCANSG